MLPILIRSTITPTNLTGSAMYRLYLAGITALVFSNNVLISIASAQDAAPAPAAAPQGSLLMDTLMMVMMLFFIFYILVIKPQNEKARAHQALMSALKKGDQVVTTGGIIAKVAGIEKDHILLEVAANVRLKVERQHVVKAYQPEKETAQQSAA